MTETIRKGLLHSEPRCTRYLSSCCFAIAPPSAALARQGNGIGSRSRVFSGLPRMSLEPCVGASSVMMAGYVPALGCHPVWTGVSDNDRVGY